MPAVPSGRMRPQVDDDVPDGTAGAPYDFRLGVRPGLIVQSAQRAAFAAPGNVALGDGAGEALRAEFLLAKATGKEPPLVFNELGAHEISAVQRSRNELQLRILTSGIGTTKRPPHDRTALICSTISSIRFQGRIRT